MAHPDWASFPPDLLLLILKNLHSPSDFISFHAVCKGWRSAVLRPHDSPSLPLLLDQNRFYDSRCLHLYSPFPTESCSIRLPQMVCKWVAGVSQGYLIVFDKVGLSLSLFNPLTRHSISLPPITFDLAESISFQPFLIHSKEMVVISHLYQGILNLGCCKIGDKGWSLVSCKVGTNGGGCAYYQGRYYVNESAEGPTMAIDPATSWLLSTIPPPKDRSPHNKSWKYSKGMDYLVESPMGLLRIFRPYDVFGCFKDCSFDIHRLNNVGSCFQWVKVGGIGDLMLFLDLYIGICTSANGVQGMQGNCIYFTKYSLHNGNGWTGILCRYDISTSTTVALSYSLTTRGSWFIPSMATIQY